MLLTSLLFISWLRRTSWLSRILKEMILISYARLLMLSHAHILINSQPKNLVLLDSLKKALLVEVNLKLLKLLDAQHKTRESQFSLEDLTNSYSKKLKDLSAMPFVLLEL